VSPLTPRQLDIVSDIGASRCVTSGAGCGKTRVLVERYVRFLEEDLALGLERLAAITFTDAAAAEMRDRIRAACRRHVEEAQPPALAGDIAVSIPRQCRGLTGQIWLNRYWDVDCAPIDTIHAFCSSLLRRYAIEAGVDPNFSLLDETAATFLVEDVVRRLMEETLGRADAAPGAAPDAASADLLAVLEHFSLDQARDILATVLREKREVLHRVAGPVLARSDDEILRGLRRAADEALLAALREALSDAPATDALQACERFAGGPDDLAEAARAAILDAVRRIGKARTAAAARQAAADVAAVNLRGGSARQWPSADALKHVKAALGTLKKAIKDVLEKTPEFQEDLERRHLALARALFATAGRAMAAYEAAKRDRSALDFEDLQILARDLLRQDERVLGECRRRFRAVLVDELQDTNLLQFEIVDLLASGAAAAREPRPAASGAVSEPLSARDRAVDAGPRPPTPLRPGALFGVGDPKQSIYRFRGAEFEVFERAQARAAPAERKSLHESFRLSAATAALVNHLFPPLMGRLYEPIEGMRPPLNGAAAELVHVTDPEGEGFRLGDGLVEESRRLASHLKETIEAGRLAVDDGGGRTRPARWGDVALLLRRMSHLHIYERAFENERIPYYVVAGRGFFKQQEVLDVLHLMRVLNDPGDDLHLAGLLRSPFFALSDEALYRLRAGGRPLWQALGDAGAAERLAEEDRRGAARAAALLPAWAAAKDRLGLAAILEEAVFQSGYAASAVGRFGGERAYANLRQMVELARRFEQQGLCSLGDYIDFVTDVLASEMRAEQAPVEQPGSDALRIMTVHKAKGLEFPIVVLADLVHAVPRPRDAFFVHPSTGLAVRMRDDAEPPCPADGAVSEPLSVSDGAVDAAPGGTPCALALARRESLEAERAESHRLLYVALTRARDFLILASHQNKRHDAGSEETWLRVLTSGLGLPLLPGEHEVQPAGGCTVRVLAAHPAREAPGRAERRVGPRDIFLAGRVAWSRLHERGQRAARRAVEDALARLAPPAPPDRPPDRITATALVTYRRCPALYRWIHVLGVDEPEPPPDAGPPRGTACPPGRGDAAQPPALPGDITVSIPRHCRGLISTSPLAPRTWGRIAHRALELAAAPDDAAVAAAVEGAIREAPLGPGPDRDELGRRLADAVRRFWQSAPGRRLADARLAHRELPFVLALGETEVGGVMDLVFQDAHGRWEIVDYKSSAPPPHAARQAGAEYRLQLGLYAAAASRWLGKCAARWTIYFLDGAGPIEQDIGPEELANALDDAGQALAGMATGEFKRADGRNCLHCRFLRLCERG